MKDSPYRAASPPPPDPYRTASPPPPDPYLVAWAELSYAEAATALGTTTSAVKSRLHRIRVRMRHELGDQYPVDEENDDE